MSRILRPLLTIILIAGVGAAIYFSGRDQFNLRRTETITGLSGSEKIPFLTDERVQKIFRANGLDVQVEKAGSRQIATSYDLSQYDFAFPAGIPAAEKIRRDVGGSKSYTPFFTPMVIASWESIAQTLVANEIAEPQGGYYTLDMDALLSLIAQETRWNELQSNPDYDINKSILISSTDVRTSNSAAMYLALASYIANSQNIIQSQTEVSQVLPFLESLFLRQGFVENSSAAPFEDYQVMGIGKAPLVMIYESQYIEQAAAPGGGLREGMVLLYPEPTIFSKHTLVSLSEAGERFGELLETNDELQKLAVEYGFRNANISYFNDFTRRNNVGVPETIVNAIEPPSYEIVEAIIQDIERRYP